MNTCTFTAKRKVFYFYDHLFVGLLRENVLHARETEYPRSTILKDNILTDIIRAIQETTIQLVGNWCGMKASHPSTKTPDYSKFIDLVAPKFSCV